MHKGKVFDIRQLARLGPNANFEIGNLLREGVAPRLRVADALIEIDQEQRHFLSVAKYLLVLSLRAERSNLGPTTVLVRRDCRVALGVPRNDRRGGATFGA